MSDFERFAPTAIILLGILALLSAFMSIPALFSLYIPAGAAQYMHFNLAEVIIRILIIIYFLAIGVVDLFIAVGFFARFDKARKTAIILAPLPFIGTILKTLGLLTPLAGTYYLLETTGISFPALASFLLGFPGVPFQEIATGNISAYYILLDGIYLLFGIANLLLIPYLRRKEVKDLFQHRKPSPKPPPPTPPTIL
jgi:hypothetical protein